MSAPDRAAPPRFAFDLAPGASAPANDRFFSSGQSPGGPTLHLIGPGRVGREFLRQLEEQPLPLRLVAVSDATATAYDRAGLSAAAVLAHKASGQSLAAWPGAERLPGDVAIEVIGADLVVDATPSRADAVEAAIARGRAALRHGACFITCAKSALATVGSDWLLGNTRGRLGIDAVLGGTGHQLVAELAELRATASGVALVGNATTTTIVTEVEQGASIEQGIEVARQRGLLEPDAALDLDGHDAATKLRIVAGLLFGEAWTRPPVAEAVRRESVRELDAELLRARRRCGVTTRLVARATRAGDVLAVAFEAVPLGSPLAAPPDRVVYTYELPDAVRVHTGLALGHERTASALLGDVRRALLGRQQPAAEVRP
ncbi:MAG: hypothetical protein IT455_04835 [Planctomycetes bacterium]|nr:hypothetical protein [Planctomycetota bacterium]